MPGDDMWGGVPLAPHDEMDARKALAREFWEITRPDVVPFVSDEATWYAFDYLDDDELLRIVDMHYGVGIGPDELRMPFWRLLDFLASNRTR